MHRHYGCTLQFEHFGVMQRFAVVDNLDAAWCSVQRGTVRSVAHEKCCTAGEGRSSLVEHRAMIFTAAKPACAVLSLVKSGLSAFFLFAGAIGRPTDVSRRLICNSNQAYDTNT